MLLCRTRKLIVPNTDPHKHLENVNPECKSSITSTMHASTWGRSKVPWHGSRLPQIARLSAIRFSHGHNIFKTQNHAFYIQWFIILYRHNALKIMHIFCLSTQMKGTGKIFSDRKEFCLLYLCDLPKSTGQVRGWFQRVTICTTSWNVFRFSSSLKPHPVCRSMSQGFLVVNISTRLCADLITQISVCQWGWGKRFSYMLTLYQL